MKFSDLILHLQETYNARILWRVEGIPDTGIDDMLALNCRGRVVILQKYREGGWELYAPLGGQP